MIAPHADGWKRLTPGAMDRVEERLRVRRWRRGLANAGALVVAAAAVAFAIAQVVTLVSPEARRLHPPGQYCPCPPPPPLPPSGGP